MHDKRRVDQSRLRIVKSLRFMVAAVSPKTQAVWSEGGCSWCVTVTPWFGSVMLGSAMHLGLCSFLLFVCALFVVHVSCEHV